MKNMSHRHRRAALKNGKAGPVMKAYVILDPAHRPDLRGEFGGVKVKKLHGKHVVHLSEKTARFYMDSGSIAPMKEQRVATPGRGISLND